LKGIQPVSPSPSDREITLLRPMIHLKREDIRRWATEHKISFREDSSNASMDHDRNRLRHEVIPILNSLGNGRFPNAFIRSYQLMAEESSMTETMAIQWLETKQKSAFQELPLALKRQVLRIQLENLAIPPRAKLIDSLIANHGNPVMFPGRKLVILDKNGGVGLASTEAHEDPITTKELTLEEGFGTFSWQNRDWYWRWVEPGQGLEGITRKKKGAETEEEWLSLDQIKLPLSVTSWNNGDRYQPLGMQGQVKLQDAFINRKIPRERRSSVPVLRDAEGAILWVEHLRPSQQVAVTKTSRKILQIGRKRPDRSNKRQSK